MYASRHRDWETQIGALGPAAGLAAAVKKPSSLCMPGLSSGPVTVPRALGMPSTQWLCDAEKQGTAWRCIIVLGSSGI